MASAKVTTDRVKGLAAIAFFGVVAIAGATLTRAWESALGVAHPADSGQSYFDGPISFEPNQGQAGENVKFVARGPGYVVYVTERGTLLALHKASGGLEAPLPGPLAINLVDGTARAQLVAQDPLSTKSSYFTGPDRTKWITGIPNFAQVQFRHAYPGVDVTCHGTHGSLRFDFRVEPGAAPANIALDVTGAAVQLTSAGDLIIRTRQGELRMNKPVAYQKISGSKRFVTARYVVTKHRVSFALGPYDASKELTIDPVLSYVDYLKQQQARVDEQGRSSSIGRLH